jgi:serine protease inhibitor
LSGAAVWPLLAALASGAHGRALDELAEAIAVPVDDAQTLVAELLHTWRQSEGLHAALGVWVAAGLSIDPAWSSSLPRGAVHELTGDPDADSAAVSAWVSEHTLGILRDQPVGVGPSPGLALLQAVAMRVDWQTPFTDVPVRPQTGRWAHTTVNGLRATFTDLDLVEVAATSVGPVTLLRCVSTGDLDVVLVQGEEHVPVGDLLGAGIGALDGIAATRSGSVLRLGETAPGLRVIEVGTMEPEPPCVDVQTIRFEVGSRHDLLAYGGIFGITTAADCKSGHFDGISRTPLCVGAAAQSARAIFSATGFEAAAVTEFMVALGSMPDEDATSLVIRVAFDRPFGFLAVHRSTGAVLMAGWIERAEPFTGDERDL